MLDAPRLLSSADTVGDTFARGRQRCLTNPAGPNFGAENSPGALRPAADLGRPSLKTARPTTPGGPAGHLACYRRHFPGGQSVLRMK